MRIVRRREVKHLVLGEEHRIYMYLLYAPSLYHPSLATHVFPITLPVPNATKRRRIWIRKLLGTNRRVNHITFPSHASSHPSLHYITRNQPLPAFESEQLKEFLHTAQLIILSKPKSR